MAVKKEKFSRIFEAGSLGSLKVKNRLIMAPMGTRLASEMGGVTQRLIDYYEERAKGGVGTVIVECTAVDYPLGSGSPKNLTIHHNSYIAGHNELVEAIHLHGAKAICQIYHVGRNTRPINIQGLRPVGPSAIPCKFINVIPRELAANEIEDIVRKFVEAAIRTKTAGYDGVELHGAHGYLIGSFMSPSSNHRNDRYGGDLNHRMNFPLEIIRGMREELGPDYPILFRLSGDEFIDGGMDLEETKEAAKILEKAGIDAVDVSAGTYDSMVTTVEPISYAQGWKIYLAESIKKGLDIPVIGVGVIRKPDFAEKLLEERRVDFVGLGRALLADPEWPVKAKTGRVKEIIPCISCNDGCLGGRIFRDLSLRCTVNPFTGREHLKDTIKPGNKKRVLIIGGGPAGMVAALTAQKRGFRVRLYERGSHLGGQLRLAAVSPGKEKIGWFLDYLLNQIKVQKVDVRLRKAANLKTVLRVKPDAIILTTGAFPLLPDIPGVNSKCVCTAWEIFEGRKEIKDKVVLIAGGGTVGCETALSIASENKKVMIVEMLGNIAIDMEPISRMELNTKIQKYGIEVLLNRKITRIGEDGVVSLSSESREEQVKVDCVILALGSTPANGLAHQVEKEIREIHIAGDCNSPRKIIDAVYEGFLAASRL